MIQQAYLAVLSCGTCYPRAVKARINIDSRSLAMAYSDHYIGTNLHLLPQEQHGNVFYHAYLILPIQNTNLHLLRRVYYTFNSRSSFDFSCPRYYIRAAAHYSGDDLPRDHLGYASPSDLASLMLRTGCHHHRLPYNDASSLRGTDVMHTTYGIPDPYGYILNVLRHTGEHQFVYSTMRTQTALELPTPMAPRGPKTILFPNLARRYLHSNDTRVTSPYHIPGPEDPHHTSERVLTLLTLNTQYTQPPLNWQSTTEDYTELFSHRPNNSDDNNLHSVYSTQMLPAHRNRTSNLPPQVRPRETRDMTMTTDGLLNLLQHNDWFFNQLFGPHDTSISDHIAGFMLDYATTASTPDVSVSTYLESFTQVLIDQTSLLTGLRTRPAFSDPSRLYTSENEPSLTGFNDYLVLYHMVLGISGFTHGHPHECNLHGLCPFTALHELQSSDLIKGTFMNLVHRYLTTIIDVSSTPLAIFGLLSKIRSSTSLSYIKPHLDTCQPRRNT